MRERRVAYAAGLAAAPGFPCAANTRAEDGSIDRFGIPFGSEDTAVRDVFGIEDFSGNLNGIRAL